jgi:N-glycosylase/DNA lyase
MTATFVNEHLNLEYTLECGQAFRWRKLEDGFYYGVTADTFIRIRQDGSLFTFETAPRLDDYATVAHYFGLDADEDYVNLVKTIQTDPVMVAATTRYYGLRLLRQEPWETLISFILSAHNNIPSIGRSVQAISKKYGEGLVLGRYRSYTFPSPQVLIQASEVELNKELGAAYRGKFILDTTRQILEQGVNLAAYRDLPYNFAHGALTNFPGVGPKVADCVLLFSLDKREAFPVDVWIQRAMDTWYFGGAKASLRDIQRLAAARWGEQAGYAQEFLYMHARQSLGRASTGLTTGRN